MPMTLHGWMCFCDPVGPVGPFGPVVPVVPVIQIGPT